VRILLAALVGLLVAAAPAAATTVTAQIEGEAIAGVPVKGSITVTGAPAGAWLWMSLHYGDCPQLPYPITSQGAVPGPDFTRPFELFQTDTDDDFLRAGRSSLCVVVGPPDEHHQQPAVIAGRADVPFTARAPRGDLAVTAARWNRRRHRLTFSLRGTSETKGDILRFLLPVRIRCPRTPPPLLQTPADLGSVGPPEDSPGPFSYTRRVTWRREIPPPGRYRVCAYLRSIASTGGPNSRMIQLARASRLVRVTR
jgi:hypothetical protein